jgi:hypothetical protein
VATIILSHALRLPLTCGMKPANTEEDFHSHRHDSVKL